MEQGQKVRILGQTTTLKRPLDCPGGWIVEPPIRVLGCTCRYWNEDEMKTTSLTTREPSQ